MMSQKIELHRLAEQLSEFNGRATAVLQAIAEKSATLESLEKRVVVLEQSLRALTKPESRSECLKSTR